MKRKKGYFGGFGGMFIPETLVPSIYELEAAFSRWTKDRQFRREFTAYLRDYVGRPTPLYFAANLSRELELTLYLKREDLCHTGSHKIINALGQALLAQKMGKERVIAETGAGQHGVAVATAAALLGLKCRVYMGVDDIERQQMNVIRMEMLGAEVVGVSTGTRTLKDAINEALRDWVTNVRDTHYILGTVFGPHPYPMMVKRFVSVIGCEAEGQLLKKEGRRPEVIVACVGGGSNAMGIFYPFLSHREIRLVGVEAGGEGIATGRHAARFQGGRIGIFQGAKSYVLQDAYGQIMDTYSIAPGLDYASIGPEHSFLMEQGRVEYTFATDEEVLEAFMLTSRQEGIIPALESSHAIAYVVKNRHSLKNRLVLVNLSGRGDKDVATIHGRQARG